MMRIAVLALMSLAASSAHAQDQQQGGADVPAAGQTMATLLADKYEIKGAVPNGNRFIVFLQKDTSAYACEFATLTSSRCGAIQ